MTRSEAGKLGAEKANETKKAKWDQFKEDYNINPTKCGYCDTALPFEKRHNKFCNSSCAASINNMKFIKRTKIEKELNCPVVFTNNKTKTKSSSDEETTYINRTHPCLSCGEEITGYHRKYCSLQCQRDYQWELKKQEICSGEYNPRNLRTIKRYIIEKEGHQCSICKNTEWANQPIPLVLDHIDGNADHNDVDNFRLVCGNCDMQLPTYKNKNIGNGRAWRRDRYNDGKSY